MQYYRVFLLLLTVGSRWFILTPWSSCSSSCTPGKQSRNRECQHISNTGTRYCFRNSSKQIQVQKRMCNTQCNEQTMSIIPCNASCGQKGFIEELSSLCKFNATSLDACVTRNLTACPALPCTSSLPPLQEKGQDDLIGGVAAATVVLVILLILLIILLKRKAASKDNSNNRSVDERRGLQLNSNQEMNLHGQPVVSSFNPYQTINNTNEVSIAELSDDMEAYATFTSNFPTTENGEQDVESSNNLPNITTGHPHQVDSSNPYESIDVANKDPILKTNKIKSLKTDVPKFTPEHSQEEGKTDQIYSAVKKTRKKKKNPNMPVASYDASKGELNNSAYDTLASTTAASPSGLIPASNYSHVTLGVSAEDEKAYDHIQGRQRISLSKQEDEYNTLVHGKPGF